MSSFILLCTNYTVTISFLVEYTILWRVLKSIKCIYFEHLELAAHRQNFFQLLSYDRMPLNKTFRQMRKLLQCSNAPKIVVVCDTR